jgi:transposase
MEEGAGWAVVDGRSCSELASHTKPDTGRLVRKEVTLYGIRRGGDGRQTQRRGRPERASTQQIAILLFALLKKEKEFR